VLLRHVVILARTVGVVTPTSRQTHDLRKILVQQPDCHRTVTDSCCYALHRTLTAVLACDKAA
jgi:hypothetical protein